MKIKDFPRPNFEELPSLYDELDRLADRVEKAIRSLKNELFDPHSELISFDKISEDDMIGLIRKDPEALVPAFTRVCGLTVREFERLYGLENVYKLRNRLRWQMPTEDERKFAKAIVEQLGSAKMYLETFVYTFYKMWEEHQKRHARGRKAEEDVRKFFEDHGYECKKLTEPVEVNGAIPPASDPKKVRVVIPIRTGVRRDLVKRAKEYSSEFDRFKNEFPNAKVIIVFRIPRYELDIKEEIRETIIEERRDKEPYDGVFFYDELRDALERFEEWKIPKRSVLFPKLSKRD